MHHIELFWRRPVSCHFKGFCKTLTLSFSIHLRELLMCAVFNQNDLGQLYQSSSASKLSSNIDSRLHRQRCSFYLPACCPLQADSQPSSTCCYRKPLARGKWLGKHPAFSQNTQEREKRRWWKHPKIVRKQHFNHWLLRDWRGFILPVFKCYCLV